MSVTELIRNVKFVVDAEGKRTAVLFDYALWDELVTLLEDIEDVQEIERLRRSGEERVPWEEAKKELLGQSGEDV